MTLHVLVGMIASGKSTYARRKADEGALVICHDDLTEMLHATYRYEQGLRECYRRMEESLAFAALNAGRDAVIDRTHLTHESRKRWIDWARDYDSLQTFDGRGPVTEVVAVLFPVDTAYVHATRRMKADRRGRTFDEWYEVTRHHLDQISSEPASISEGFHRIIQE